MIRYEVVNPKYGQSFAKTPDNLGRKIYVEAFLILEVLPPEHVQVEQVHPGTGFISQRGAFWEQKVTIDTGAVLDIILDNKDSFFVAGEYIRYDVAKDNYTKFDKENVSANLRLVHEDPLPRKFQKRKTYAS